MMCQLDGLASCSWAAAYTHSAGMCAGPHAAGGTLEFLMKYSVVMQHLRNRIVHGHLD